LNVGAYRRAKATPAAVSRMFAYRACHSAVRIGMDLKHSDMRRIVDHMSEMDHPWVSALQASQFFSNH
jgi:DNA mismatch repair ATPase MutL